MDAQLRREHKWAAVFQGTTKEGFEAMSKAVLKGWTGHRYSPALLLRELYGRGVLTDKNDETQLAALLQRPTLLAHFTYQPPAPPETFTLPPQGEVTKNHRGEEERHTRWAPVFSPFTVDQMDLLADLALGGSKAHLGNYRLLIKDLFTKATLTDDKDEEQVQYLLRRMGIPGAYVPPPV